ncbi:MAG: hypothetical protein LBL86_02510 [Coriobacteriales bacterium]|nr:hypothetical protein [Coriobacteriales bacterium]
MEKNTVPLPLLPETGGSSQWWSAARATRSVPSAPQRPRSPARRFALQRRGQSVQEVGRRSAASRPGHGGTALS